MIGVDTNVLVRMIIADDPRQAAAARELIADQCTPDDPDFISNIVLAELAWILARGYGYSRSEIARAIERVMETSQLQVESSNEVAAALVDYRNGPADFTDCLVGHVNRAAGCSRTVTFGRKAAKLGGFELLKA